MITMSNDLIDRQAAIDAVEKESQVDGAYGYMDTMSIVDLLNDLPFVQLEIIRCRECKFASGDSRICMKFGHSPIGELDFCAWAERRTDEQTD